MALFDTIRAGASGAADYEIERSLRFNANSSTNMHREGGSNGNQRTFTVSFWAKRSKRAEHSFFDWYTNDANRTIFQFYFGSMRLFSRVSNSTQMSLQSTCDLRDPTAWYHVLYKVDTTQSTQSNRVKIFVNGIEQPLTGSYPSQNAETYVGSNNENRIGCQHDSAGNEAFYDGYLAEFHYIDGTALDVSSFTETDAATGELKPIEYSGSYGTKGYYLNFSNNSSTSNLGLDSSGNGNNFTSVSNFSVSTGIEDDSVTDTPTNNWCVFNEQAKHSNGNVTLTNGNLDAAFGSVSGGGGVAATHMVSSGKWYWEITMTSDANASHIGVITGDNPGFGNDTFYEPGLTSDSFSYQSNGTKYNNNSNTSYGASYGNGDVIGVKLDLDNGTIGFLKNNSDQGTAFTGLSGDYIPACGDGNSSDSFSLSANFGSRGFTYTIPTGYKPLTSQNLPSVPVPDGTKEFNHLLYTGNGSNRSITVPNSAFGPEFVWVKKRSGGSARSHQLFDILRGPQMTLHSDGGDTSHSNSNRLSSFNSDGFSIGTSGGDDGINTSGHEYIAWMWNAASSSSTNTDGSISSTVRANPTAGFSIVRYTSGGNNQTIGHGLGAAPTFIILKNEDSNVDWNVFADTPHFTMGDNDVLNLNNSDALGTSGSNAFIRAVSSSTFTLGNSLLVSENSSNFIAYCWTNVPGFCRVGTYTGNGSTDGAFVHTGFQPNFLLIKCVSNPEHYNIPVFHKPGQNGGAGDYVGTQKYLSPNLNNHERNMDQNPSTFFYSNGFKITTSDGNINRQSSNNNFIYLAVGRIAFKHSRAR